MFTVSFTCAMSQTSWVQRKIVSALKIMLDWEEVSCQLVHE